MQRERERERRVRERERKEDESESKVIRYKERGRERERERKRERKYLLTLLGPHSLSVLEAKEFLQDSKYLIYFRQKFALKKKNVNYFFIFSIIGKPNYLKNKSIIGNSVVVVLVLESNLVNCAHGRSNLCYLFKAFDQIESSHKYSLYFPSHACAT